jgi:hypothetical protein
LFQRCVAGFFSQGYARREDCVNLAHGHHHWHYRSAGSLGREEYPGFLRQQRFGLEETWKDEE